MNGENKSFCKKSGQKGLLPSAIAFMLLFLMVPVVKGMEEPVIKARPLTTRESWEEKLKRAKERKKAGFFAKAIPAVAEWKGLEPKADEPEWLLKLRAQWIDAGTD